MVKKKQSTYSYDISMTYVNGNKQTSIDKKSISMILIEYDYDNNNAPIILVNLNLKVPVYNDMIKHCKSGKVYLNITIYTDGKTNAIKKNYIKEQFSYFFSSSNLETDEDLIKDSGSNDTTYRKSTIGLIKSELVDNNKKIMNNIFKNTNMSSIIHFYTNHMKMVIEPFDNNPVYNLFIVPPIEGISKLLKFLNESGSFYKTTYRYFMDFNKTYLLSTKGKAIDINDGTHNTIKFNIINDNGIHECEDGMTRDDDNKIYIVEINAGDFHLTKNNVTEKKYNKLYGVDSMGNKSSRKLDINNEKGSSSKTHIVRVFNDNLDYLESMASEIENTSAVITLAKGNIDMSLIVPYKEYRISNTKQYKDLDDKYLLVSKREVIIQNDGDFSCSASMSFKRVP